MRTSLIVIILFLPSCFADVDPAELVGTDESGSSDGDVSTASATSTSAATSASTTTSGGSSTETTESGGDSETGSPPLDVGSSEGTDDGTSGGESSSESGGACAPAGPGVDCSTMPCCGGLECYSNMIEQCCALDVVECGF